ncbi:MAG: hypothetical protein D3923_00715 [Candidatus Electrothrix sp. AR3]|nr:hypothetical protein [Candidatus Electrothrix sp. AR3]
MITTESDFLLLFPFKKSISLVFLVLVFCLPLQAKEQGDFFTSHASSKKNSYTVGPEDILSVDVYDNPDLKGLYTVTTHGDIVFPLLGQINVSGMTIAAIKDKLTTLLEKDYLYNPIVSVIISKYQSKKVKIIGNVGKPGIYYLDSPLRFFDLLTKAGGVSSQLGTIMSGHKAHIIRNRAIQKRGKAATTKISTLYVDLHQLLIEGKDEANIYLQSGDVIYIPDGSYFHVVGEVKKIGSFPYEQGTTVLKAITLAGGATQKASTKNIAIKRLKNGKVLQLEANMDTLLKPDDIVDVPLSFW